MRLHFATYFSCLAVVPLLRSWWLTRARCTMHQRISNVTVCVLKDWCRLPMCSVSWSLSFLAPESENKPTQFCIQMGGALRMWDCEWFFIKAELSLLNAGAWILVPFWRKMRCVLVTVVEPNLKFAWADLNEIFYYIANFASKCPFNWPKFDLQRLKPSNFGFPKNLHPHI